MTPEELDTKLTAYALNDPSLTEAERSEIEIALRSDPAVRQQLEETRHLGHLLSKSLAAEAEPSVAPASAKPRSLKRWAITIASLAAVVMLAVFAGQAYFQRTPTLAQNTTLAPAKKFADKEVAADSMPMSRESTTLSTVAKPVNMSEQRYNDGSPALPAPVVLSSLPSPAPTTGGPYGYDVAPGVAGAGIPGGLVAPPGSKPSSGPAPTNPFGAIAKLEETAPNDFREAREQRDTEVRKKLNSSLNKQSPSGNSYKQLVENPFTRVEGMDALSTFGVDVDTASYSIVRNYLNHNSLPHPDAVRLEEMINYFPYRDAPPDGAEPFTVRVEMAECPWQPKHRLARVALKAKPIDNSKRPPSNLVFLIDVSGSMDAPNRLPLVKASMKLLTEQLGENDRVAIVVYAGASGLVLDSTNAGKKDAILKALDNLSAGGSTNGGSGIQLAYDVAVRNFIEKGTNRVILCTDGDWNVGTTGTEALVKLIEEKKTTGVFLSIFGFGMGNLRDEMMVQLAGKGNGNYGYIDTIQEAKKALVEQIGGTLVTVAKDVKIQIEFNPAKVAAYRLIGYEKRKLAAEDFHNDKKDAGEMGAGHVVTALYELVPPNAVEALKVDGLRYQQAAPAVEQPMKNVAVKVSNEAFVVKLRHKAPDAETSTLREVPVTDAAGAFGKASEDFQFASSVAAFGMLLKQSPYKGQASYALVEELAASSMTHDPGAYRAEFLQLVKKAKSLADPK